MTFRLELESPKCFHGSTPPHLFIAAGGSVASYAGHMDSGFMAWDAGRVCNNAKDTLQLIGLVFVVKKEKRLTGI